MITSTALSADGRLAVSGGWYQPLRLWDLASGTCLHTFESQKRSEAYSLSVTANFRRALTVGSTEVRLWDIGSGSLVKNIQLRFEGNRPRGDEPQWSLCLDRRI
jgi:WD40 repeat protein